MPHKGGNIFTQQESTELLQHIAQNMVTKADVRVVVTEVVSEIVPPMIRELVPPMLNKAKHEIMDYVDRKDREYKGELNMTLQKEDKKIDAVIDALHDKKIVDASHANELKKLTPFAVRV